METLKSKSFAKYLAIIWVSFSQGLKTYKVLLGQCIFLITCIIIFANLWKIAVRNGGTISFTADQLLWYIAFNEWIIIAIPDIQNSMEHELRSGRLAYLLLRPISYLGAKFAEGTGILLLHLSVLGPIAFLLSWFWTETIPFSTGTFVIALLLGIVAGFVGLIFQMIVGLTAFWLHEVAPITWIWEKFMLVFGGIMLPLTTYPIWMQWIAEWTPFPAILGGRSALVINPNAFKLAWFTGLLILWFLIGCICLRLLFRKGLRILNIEGG